MIEKLIESVKVKPICPQRRWSCGWSAAELQSDLKMLAVAYSFSGLCKATVCYAMISFHLLQNTTGFNLCHIGESLKMNRWIRISGTVILC